MSQQRLGIVRQLSVHVIPPDQLQADSGYTAAQPHKSREDIPEAVAKAVAALTEIRNCLADHSTLTETADAPAHMAVCSEGPPEAAVAKNPVQELLPWMQDPQEEVTLPDGQAATMYAVASDGGLDAGAGTSCCATDSEEALWRFP